MKSSNACTYRKWCRKQSAMQNESVEGFLCRETVFLEVCVNILSMKNTSNGSVIFVTSKKKKKKQKERKFPFFLIFRSAVYFTKKCKFPFFCTFAARAFLFTATKRLNISSNLQLPALWGTLALIMVLSRGGSYIDWLLRKASAPLNFFFWRPGSGLEQAVMLDVEELKSL